MREILADTKLIAYCGLYCGACKRYLKESCQGCLETTKAGWCKIRKCNQKHNHNSCADCTMVENYRDCKKLNTPISKFFEIVMRSDRLACLERIKAKGYEAYAREMAEAKRPTIKR